METENNQDSTNLQTPQRNLPAQVVRELSTEQQSQWVERLFKRMLAIYGDRFSSMWTHSSADEMKRVWADALGGFSGETLAEALKACYKEPYCPNLPQFVLLCRQNMRGQFVAKPDETPLSHEQALKILKEAEARMPERKPEAVDHRKWAKDIVRWWQDKSYTYYGGYKLACEALGIDIETGEIRGS